MKKLTFALFLIVAFCLVAVVSPVVADASTNPANAGINSTSPFWFKDYTPASGKTLAAVFTAPTYIPASGKTLAAVFTAPKYIPASGKTLTAVFTVPKMSTIKTSSGGYYYAPA